MTLLFATRLTVYLVAIAIPIVHPGVAISYDRVGWVTWFALIPAEMALAAFLQPPRMRLSHWLLSAVGLSLLAALVGPGLDLFSLSVIGIGLAAFVLTAIVFHGREHGHIVAAGEILFVGYIFLKLLRFSRASDMIAAESSRITTIIVVMITCGFLLHALSLYLTAFPESGGRVRRREIMAFLLLSLPASAALGLLLPTDFVSNRIAFNRLNEVARPKPQPINDSSAGPDGGNLLPLEQQQGSSEGANNVHGEDNNQWQDGQGERSQRQQLIEGIPAERWNDSSSGEGGSRGEVSREQQGAEEESDAQEGGGDRETKQYARMVIASATDPVYAADGYYADLHPESGFLFSTHELLNDLVHQRLLTTWVDVLRLPDRGREELEYYFLSSIPDRVMPYRPFTIEPTVQNRLYHPFDLSYRTVSRVSATDPEQWQSLNDLSPAERTALAPYLNITLTDKELIRFTQYAEEVTAGAPSYYNKIDAILRSYETFQYKIGFTDDVSIKHLERFLFETRTGDCTEFSNSTAIIGRIVGIPSRVVTGWLGTESLQSPMHQRGLQNLREVIEPLQEFPLDQLYLITTAHRHSWTQFYLPSYGWVDIEPTQYAIPPQLNAMRQDIVIPIIQIEDRFDSDFKFPWLLSLRLAGSLAFAGIFGAYTWRYGREGVLRLAARSPSRHGLRARASLMYMRLAADGYAVKSPTETAKEYAERYPELDSFAELYTTLRYRPNPPDTHASDELLFSSQKAIQRMRRRGMIARLRRLVSLRGLSC